MEETMTMSILPIVSQALVSTPKSQVIRRQIP